MRSLPSRTMHKSHRLCPAPAMSASSLPTHEPVSEPVCALRDPLRTAQSSVWRDLPVKTIVFIGYSGCSRPRDPGARATEQPPRATTKIRRMPRGSLRCLGSGRPRLIPALHGRTVPRGRARSARARRRPTRRNRAPSRSGPDGPEPPALACRLGASAPDGTRAGYHLTSRDRPAVGSPA